MAMRAQLREKKERKRKREREKDEMGRENDMSE